MQIQPPPMTSPTPKQDGQTIDLDAIASIWFFDTTGTLFDVEAKAAIEAYCENERRKAVEEYIASQEEGDGTK